MDFDTYWENLVHRVYRQNEVLAGDEALFYSLACIYGETMVDGVEAYFERRFSEFEKDMTALVESGFEDVASDFREARRIMFGDSPLNEENVSQVVDRLLDEDAEVMHILEKLGLVYDRLIARLPDVADYKYDFGIQKGLYQEEA